MPRKMVPQLWTRCLKTGNFSKLLKTPSSPGWQSAGFFDFVIPGISISRYANVGIYAQHLSDNFMHKHDENLFQNANLIGKMDHNLFSTAPDVSRVSGFHYAQCWPRKVRNVFFTLRSKSCHNESLSVVLSMSAKLGSWQLLVLLICTWLGCT